MIRALLIGIATGARALTPLAVVCEAAREGRGVVGQGAPGWMSSRLAGAAVAALAVGEALGDKLPSAPDRIVTAGLLARVASAGASGAALAPPRRALLGAAAGASAAVASAFATFALRRRAMARFGQVPTGVVEDALCLGLARLAVRDGRR